MGGSATVLLGAAAFRAERRALSYRFVGCGGISGGEKGSLLPFCWVQRHFGWRDGLSPTVLLGAVAFRAERKALSYRFADCGGTSGLETASASIRQIRQVSQLFGVLEALY